MNVVSMTDIGIHRVENRSEELACTLHVYAPPLRKMKVFDQDKGLVHVHVAESQASGGSCMLPDEGIFDVEAWNRRLVRSCYNFTVFNTRTNILFVLSVIYRV
jgi:hypothetical protein